jgi:predicted metal-binding protein
MSDKVSIFVKALGNRPWEWGLVSTADIIFLPELRKACEQNICGNYAKNWGCPPGNGTFEELKEKVLAYPKALVFTTKYQLEDSFDFDGMKIGGTAHKELTHEMQERFGKDYPVLGAGCCEVCGSCAYPEACRFPDKRIIAIEAAGISVGELSRTAGVKYNNGESTVTYFSMILFD